MNSTKEEKKVVNIQKRTLRLNYATLYTKVKHSPEFPLSINPNVVFDLKYTHSVMLI